MIGDKACSVEVLSSTAAGKQRRQAQHTFSATDVPHPQLILTLSATDLSHPQLTLTPTPQFYVHTHAQHTHLRGMRSTSMMRQRIAHPRSADSTAQSLATTRATSMPGSTRLHRIILAASICALACLLAGCCCCWVGWAEGVAGTALGTEHWTLRG
eukprot:1161569-Pelagomonas_calceolata.AAC.2